MSAPHDPPPGDLLRYLRVLVTTLTVVLILGISSIVVLLFLRLGPMTETPALPLPEALTLPEGTRAVAVTVAPAHLLVVTDDDRLLVFDRSGEELRQAITLD